MKTMLFFLLCLLSLRANTQSAEQPAIERACLNYIEGFYEGDTAKLVSCLSPTLHKFGYFKDKTEQYTGDAMSYRQALDFAKGVLAKKRFAKPDAPKTVAILDVQEQIACAKVVAWWGMDYILLAKKGGTWWIEQVLWQGPLKTVNH
ncbi:MAG: nuclear transport factor 2 family protein [Lewinellaceae bacterium]|nr:nuclear transport factor 2 family protein [Lewinellaceae bacterium]